MYAEMKGVILMSEKQKSSVSDSAVESLALMWVEKNAKPDSTPSDYFDLYQNALTEIRKKRSSNTKFKL